MDDFCLATPAANRSMVPRAVSSYRPRLLGLAFLLFLGVLTAAVRRELLAEAGDIDDGGTLLYVPIGLSRMTSVATPARPADGGAIPTATPTLMIAPAPPALTYANCVVHERRYEGGDGRLTIARLTRYNRSSRRTLALVDNANGESDGSYDEETAFSYRDGWQLTGVVTRDLVGDRIASSSRYEYDGESRLARVIEDRDGDGVDDYVTVYTFDSNGRLRRESGSGGGTSEITVYDYGSGGQLTGKQRDWNGDGVVDYAVRYIWTDGLITEEAIDVNGDGRADSVSSFQYDVFRRLRRWINVSGEWFATYTDEGWITRLDYYRDDEWEWTEAYEYDEGGRLTVRTVEDPLGREREDVFANECVD